MKEHEKYQKISDLLIGAGIILFFLFLIFMLRFWSEEIHVYNSRKNRLVDTVSLMDGQEKHRFLFLSSYGAVFETFEDQLKGIRSILDAHNINLDLFSMHSKRFDRQEDYDAFGEYLGNVLSERAPYDAVIVGDDAALEFIMKHQEELFPEIPIVFFAVNNEATAYRAAQNEYICGYTEPEFLDSIIETAMKLQPEADRVVCIYDETETGIADRQNFFSYEDKFPELSFEGINYEEHTPEELVMELSRMDKRTILIYLSAFKDRNGKSYTISESVEWICSHSGTPVYRDGVGGFGSGITGGKMLDFVRLGANAAYVATEIVEKKIPVNEIHLSASTPGTYVFDYEQLKRYNLDPKLLPKSTVLLNAPGEGLDTYLHIGGIVFLLIASLACFWGNASLNRHISDGTAEMLKEKNHDLMLLQQELTHEARYDNMTNLMNRHTALDYLRVQLQKEANYTAILMDIDNLKEINESHGHELGDEYLKKIGNALREYSYTHRVLVSRFGGDAFLIVFLKECLSMEDYAVQEIISIFKQPLEVGTGKILMSASGGAATSELSKGIQVVMDADTAAAEAKRGGKNQLIFYSDKMKSKTDFENRLRRKVQEAIVENSFYMVYQPQVECGEKRVSGYEALVRMRGENISPALFIPLAERYGFVSTIGRMTTHMAIRQLDSWKQEGCEPVPVSVNFSSYQLNDPGYVDYVLELLSEYNVEPKLLVLEITEGILLEESDISKQMFKRLSDAGIGIHLDDFGTGYSSFEYLSYIPISAIKLDKSLVDRYLEDNEGVIGGLIDAIHSLGKRVIVEGVEEKWQYEKLCTMSCDTIQGYYFSKPEEAERIREWEPSEC